MVEKGTRVAMVSDGSTVGTINDRESFEETTYYRIKWDNGLFDWLRRSAFTVLD